MLYYALPDGDFFKFLIGQKYVRPAIILQCFLRIYLFFVYFVYILYIYILLILIQLYFSAR